MKSFLTAAAAVLLRKASLLALTASSGLWLADSVAAPNVVLWDTSNPPTAEPNLQERTRWTPVPNDLLTLETNPPKASSDPGYYGREYAFKGDAVVENRELVAFFCSANGQVIIYPKANKETSGTSAPTGGAQFGPPVHLAALHAEPNSARLSRIALLRNSDDQVVLQVAFQGSTKAAAILAFDKSEIVEVRPSPDTKGFSLLGAFEHGIVPGFIGDDLIFGPETAAEATNICVPSENMFLGLLRGETSELVITWPKGNQQIDLDLRAEPGASCRIESINFDNDGQSFYLAPLAAPGLWHRERLSSAFLEKDVAIDWKRPFPAKWKTQLYEEALPTTFAFHASKGEIWRGVPGSYDYPVWFDGDQAFYHLGKKIPPKGESVVYFLEGQGTPPEVSTPVDVLRASLGRPFADTILDAPGRKLRTHHRRGGDGVHRACTCGCTEAIQAVFEAGDEVARKADIQGDLQDMVFFVHCHVDRINEYRRFADDLQRFLQAAKTSTPELGPFIESLDQIVGRIPKEYAVQQENMKSFAYADDLVGRTLALTDKKAPNNLQAYMDLLKEWRGMGGAQDYVLAQCHTITRALAQQAGYGCALQPKAVALAKEVRARARQCLRNPDGYEIWADY